MTVSNRSLCSVAAIYVFGILTGFVVFRGSDDPVYQGPAYQEFAALNLDYHEFQYAYPTELPVAGFREHLVAVATELMIGDHAVMSGDGLVLNMPELRELRESFYVYVLNNIQLATERPYEHRGVGHVIAVPKSSAENKRKIAIGVYFDQLYYKYISVTIGITEEELNRLYSELYAE